MCVSALSCAHAQVINDRQANADSKERFTFFIKICCGALIALARAVVRNDHSGYLVLGPAGARTEDIGLILRGSRFIGNSA
jgi:hypothetical protein